MGPAGRGCIGVFVTVGLSTSDYREEEFIRHSAFDTPRTSTVDTKFYRFYFRPVVFGTVAGTNLFICTVEEAMVLLANEKKRPTPTTRPCLAGLQA